MAGNVEHHGSDLWRMWLYVGLLASVSGAGCDAFAGLRAFFRAEPEATLAGLRVDVDPADGLGILLDGVQVGSIAQYENIRLTPGRHLLEVRCDGYFPFVLPLELTAGETTRLTVALRRRVDVGEAAPPEAADPGTVTLLVHPKPAVPVTLDGQAVRGNAVTLVRSDGELGVGVLRLTYRLAAGGLVEVEIPVDAARWWKDGATIATGIALGIDTTPIRLRRAADDGTDQTVVVRRR